MGRQIAGNRDEDVPALVRVAPRAELPDSRLQHLIRMEACIFAQHLCVPKTLSELMTCWNRLSWWNDRAVLFRSAHAGAAIQVEGAA